MLLPDRHIAARDLGRTLWKKTLENDLLDYAGSIAFSAILAVFPFLLFAVSLASLVIDPGTLGSVVEEVRRVMPAQAADIIIHRLQALTSGPSAGIVTVGAALAVWSASGAVSSLISAFNRAYGVRESRAFWRTRGLALVVTVAGAAFFVAAAALALITPVVARALGGPIGTLCLWLRWPAAALLMTLILAILYYVLPDVKQDFHLVTPGSLVAVALWILVSLGFSAYTSHFGRYEVVYGALGGVIVLLLWLWLSAVVVLLGAEINAVTDHRAPIVPSAGSRVGSAGRARG